MINGKFFTGLPANMVDRRPTQNRQESHFFWPDDTQNVSTVDSRTKRRASVQAENRNAYNSAPRGEYSNNSDAENKERFKKEFTRSSIQFYDKVEEPPLRRNRQKVTAAPPPQQKLQNVEPPANMLAKRKENLSSKIEFFDYADSGTGNLNNVPKTDKNNKVELERNTKNSPKLQNKNLSFDPPDEAINFIENDVRDMRIGAPPRRRNTMRDSRPRYARPLDPVEPLYSDIHDEYSLAPRSRSRPLPPPIRSRYPESDPDFDEYIPRRSNPRPPYYPRDHLDFVDGHPSARNNFYDGGGVSSRKLGRQVEFTYSSANEYNSNYGDSPPPPPPPSSSSRSSSAQQRMPRKAHDSKVDNDIRNNEQRRMMMPPPPTTSQPPPHSSTPPKHHLRSNICFSDTESAPASSPGSPGPPPTAPAASAAPAKRNIRSSAVNRVSVGLPD